MRPALFALVLLTCVQPGCRKRRTPTVDEAPAVAAAPPAEVPAPPAAAPPAPPSSEPLPDRDTPPTDDELRAALAPTFRGLGDCIARHAAPGQAGPFPLKFVVGTSGQVVDANLVGLDEASACVRDALSRIALPAWRGAATIVTVSLQRSGEPVPAADAGAPHQ